MKSKIWAAVTCMGLMLANMQMPAMTASAATIASMAAAMIANLDAEELEIDNLAAQALGYDDFMDAALSMLNDDEDENVPLYLTHMVDLNGDGKCNGSDALFITRFMHGKEVYGGVSNGIAYGSLLDMDVNEDKVVDERDSQAYLAGHVWRITGLAPNFTAASRNTLSNDERVELNHFYESRQYRKYTRTSTNYTPYTIGGGATGNPLPETPSNGTNIPSSSTGSYVTSAWDSRIVKVDFGGVGTGFIVGSHTILTAAHCVWKNGAIVSRSSWNSGFKLYNNSTLTIQSIHVPEDYIINVSNSNTNIKYWYDMALVEVQQDLSSYGCFELGVATRNLTTQTNSWVTVSGCPKGNNPNFTIEQCRFVPIYAESDNQYWQVHQLRVFGPFVNDGFRGFSGGPFYKTVDSGNDVAIGIFSSGASYVNYGTRITPNVLRFVFNNPQHPNV